MTDKYLDTMMMAAMQHLRQIVVDNEEWDFESALTDEGDPQTLGDFIEDILDCMHNDISDERSIESIDDGAIRMYLAKKEGKSTEEIIKLMGDATLSITQVINFWAICNKTGSTLFLDYYINTFDYHVYSL